MRYFRIYPDMKNPQPNFINWYSKIKPGRTDSQIYEELEERNHFQVDLKGDVPFLDIICHPCFMVSKECAGLIRLYNPEMSFKYATLLNVRTQKMVLFYIPVLAEIICLDERSELSRDRSEMKHAILKAESIGRTPIFRLGGVKGRHIIASLEFIESAYRREIMGMKIEEYLVE